MGVVNVLWVWSFCRSINDNGRYQQDEGYILLLFSERVVQAWDHCLVGVVVVVSVAYLAVYVASLSDCLFLKLTVQTQFFVYSKIRKGALLNSEQSCFQLYTFLSLVYPYHNLCLGSFYFKGYR